MSLNINFQSKFLSFLCTDVFKPNCLKVVNQIRACLRYTSCFSEMSVDWTSSANLLSIYQCVSRINSSFSFCRVIVSLQIAHLPYRKEGFLSARQRRWLEYYKTPPGCADIPETYAIKTLYQFNQFSFIVSPYCAQCLKSNFSRFPFSFWITEHIILIISGLFLYTVCCNAYVFDRNRFLWNTALWHMWAMSCPDFHYSEIFSFLKSRTHLSGSWCLLKM